MKRKLTSEQVREIRRKRREHCALLVKASKFSCVALGIEYGISPEVIWRIEHGQTYVDVSD